MDSGPNITTERLLLRPLETEDAQNFYALNADPVVMKFVPDKPFPNVFAASAFLQHYVSIHPPELRRCAVLRRSDNAWLGWCGLKYDKESGETDLGFRFHQSCWGRGYATESARAVLRQTLPTIKLGKIVGRTATANLASQRVLEKCGFQLIGTFENPDWKGRLYELKIPNEV